MWLLVSTSANTNSFQVNRKVNTAVAKMPAREIGTMIL